MLQFFVEIFLNALDQVLVVLEKLSMLHDFSVHADMFAAPVFEFLLKYYIPTNVYACKYGYETPEKRN